VNVVRRNACRDCRRPIVLVLGIGWLHSELPQYAHEPMTCGVARPVDDEDYGPGKVRVGV
jgi:hypothetical protein